MTTKKKLKYYEMGERERRAHQKKIRWALNKRIGILWIIYFCYCGVVVFFIGQIHFQTNVRTNKRMNKQTKKRVEKGRQQKIVYIWGFMVLAAWHKSLNLNRTINEYYTGKTTGKKKNAQKTARECTQQYNK